MTVIKAAHYAETEKRLTQDPIVIAMAEELRDAVPRTEMVHPGPPGDTLRFEFMQAANKEYRKRGGTDGGHIGAVGRAIINVLDGVK